MKAEDVVRQLKAVLPKVTDLFSEKLTITSLTRAGTTVTAVTSTAHELSTGNSVVVTGALSPIAISSLTFADGIATAITATSQDLTERWENGKPSDNPEIKISGAAQSEYNGSNPLLSVPNRTKFTYTVTGTPSSPATGSPKLLEQFSSGYNGVHTITVTNTTTFTYEITQAPNSPAQGTIEVHKNVRISRAVTIERASEAYTKKDPDKLWAFVILGDVTSSKNRNVESEATDTQGAGTEFRQRLIMPFSTFIFVPTSQQLSAGEARDQMEDVRVALYRSLLRAKFDTGLQSETKYGVISEGDAFFDYVGAIYTHQFIFSTITDIIYDDSIDPDDNVAFRDIELEFLDDLGTVELTAKVNLDEEL